MQEVSQVHLSFHEDFITHNHLLPIAPNDIRR